jgi:hypothetical protein
MEDAQRDAQERALFEAVVVYLGRGGGGRAGFLAAVSIAVLEVRKSEVLDGKLIERVREVVSGMPGVSAAAVACEIEEFRDGLRDLADAEFCLKALEGREIEFRVFDRCHPEEFAEERAAVAKAAADDMRAFDLALGSRGGR